MRTLLELLEDEVNSVKQENWENVVDVADDHYRLIASDDYDVQRGIDIGMIMGLELAIKIIQRHD